MNDYEKALMAFLQPMVNERRLELLNGILLYRTRYVTVLLEDLFQSHNASAVLRSCDCFGIQDVHIVENNNKYSTNPDIELGSAQWLNIFKHNKDENNSLAAINSLKDRGYRIVATTPHNDDIKLLDFDLDKGPVALLFGTERHGLSEIALEAADEYLNIPMYGFTESLNISVSAAIILHTLRARLIHSEIEWMLEEEEMELIRLQWIKNSIKNVGRIERNFKKRFLK